jgi:hypothetical protein
MTPDQIKRAAALYAAIEAADKDIAIVLSARRIGLFGYDESSNPAGRFERARSKDDVAKGSWPDDTAALLHNTLVRQHRSIRARYTRELAQMGLSVPEARR